MTSPPEPQPHLAAWRQRPSTVLGRVIESTRRKRRWLLLGMAFLPLVLAAHAPLKLKAVNWSTVALQGGPAPAQTNEAAACSSRPDVAPVPAPPLPWTEDQLTYAKRVEGTPGWVTVLEYHEVAPRATNVFTVSVSALREQMKAIQRGGRPVLTVHDLISAIRRHDVPWGSVVITFDDGYQGVYKYALPILRSFGFRATAFVIGIDSYVPAVGAGHMTVAQLAQLQQNGWDVESHSFNLHPPSPVHFGNAPWWLVSADLAMEDRLLACLGSPHESFAYPGGFFTAASKALIEQNYLLAFGGGPGESDPTDLWDWPRKPVSSTTSVP